MSPEQEIPIHLAEYKALRDETDHYAQRIDRMSGVYLTALFGIAGYLLRPDSQFDVDKYIASVQASKGLTILFLFLSILNSVLLIRIGSFFAGLLAITQYINYVIQPRLIALVGHDVIRWDESPTLSAKKIWMPLRFLGQALFFAIAELISMTILFSSLHVFQMTWPYITVYIVTWIFLLLSVGSMIAVAKAGASYHPEEGATSAP